MHFKGISTKFVATVAFCVMSLLPLAADAELPWEFDRHTRYMAMGDSIAAGYGAVPATQGYVYRLYGGGAFDTVPNTILSNAAVPGSTSGDVLDYQVPQALKSFRPHAITLSVGGNDLLKLVPDALGGTLDEEKIQAALSEFGAHLSGILTRLLVTGLDPEILPLDPGTRIYIANQYTVPLPEIEQADQIVQLFNGVVNQVVSQFSQFNISVVDIYSVFKDRAGLLLIERHGAGQFEVHPTNAGHRAIARAFHQVIGM